MGRLKFAPIIWWFNSAPIDLITLNYSDKSLKIYDFQGQDWKLLIEKQ
jgi:hypothetical protein